MADITEVIHKITYEVDDAALQRVQGSIQLQIQEFNALNKSLQDIQRQIARIGNAEIDKLEELSKKLDAVTAKITTGAARTKGMMEQIGSGMLKAAGAGDGLEGIVAKFLTPFIAGIPKLIQGSTTIATLATRVLSFSNVISASISVLTLLVDYFINADTKADALTDSMKEAQDALKEYAQAAASEVAKFSSLYNVINSSNTSLAQKKTAMNELRELYPEYLGKLKDEEFYTDKATAAYSRLTDAIYKRARAKIYQKKLEELIEQEIILNEQIAEQKKKYKAPQEPYSYKWIGGKLTRTENFYMDMTESGRESDKAHNIVKQLDQKLSTVVQKIREYENMIAENYVPVTSDHSSSLSSSTSSTTGSTTSSTTSGTTGSSTSRRTRTPWKKPKNETIEPLQYRSNLKLLPVEKPELRNLQPVDIEASQKAERERRRIEQEAKEKEAQERRREQIKKSIEAYQQLADAASQAFQTIYEAQVKALDKEIAIRQKRVDEAMKLAERGNTEVLRQEEERLKEVQKKREQYARREQVVNAAVTISNAIVAIAKAAAEGAGQGGYGAIATVAATIAALAAGYAAVQSLSSNTESFKDGVVDYRGTGGPRDDANWVRISSGESVITAGGTKANRQLLEAINNGAQFRMLNPALAFTMPAFAQPAALQQGRYASAHDMRTLEHKLDNVVSAIEDNRMKQDIFFNEHGVGLMTERAIRKNNRRFR